MKTKNEVLLQTHGDRDLNIVSVHKAMAIYAAQWQNEWHSVDDKLPETKDHVFIWRWDMPFVGYYDITKNWWVVNGVSDIGDVDYWMEVRKP